MWKCLSPKALPQPSKSFFNSKQFIQFEGSTWGLQSGVMQLEAKAQLVLKECWSKEKADSEACPICEKYVHWAPEHLAREADGVIKLTKYFPDVS